MSLFRDLFRVRVRFPNRGAFRSRQVDRRFVAALDELPFAMPKPLFPPLPNKPPRTTVPFPTGPAANDPIFSIGKQLIRRGLAALGAVITALDIIEMVQIERFKQEQFGREEDLRRAKQKRADEQERRVVEFPADPLPPTPPPTVPRPSAPDFPDLPAPDVFEPSPVIVPTFPVGVPGLPGVNIPSPQLPAPARRPRTPTLPSTPQLPQPAPRGIPLGQPFPGIFESPAPVPRSTPLSDPSPIPFGDPLSLTSPRPGVPVFGNPFVRTFVDPQAQPQPQSDKCQIVRRRRRKKGKCREGFFRETARGTQFIEWRTINCATATFKRVRSEF